MPSKELASKAQSVLDFASHLRQFLSTDSNLCSEDFPDVLLYIHALPLQRKQMSPDQRVQFDKNGVALWNTCCKLSGSDGGGLMLKNLAKTRAFSYLLLESSASVKMKGQPRLLKAALKASKSCLDTGILEIASKVVELLATQQENLSQVPEQPGTGEVTVADGLKTQYLILRVALAWKQDRPELADHFYTQIEALPFIPATEHTCQLIDLCYEMGNAQLARNQSSLAVKWLRRGSQLSNHRDVQAGDVDFHNLRLTIMHTFVRALLSSEDPEHGKEALQTLECLNIEYAHKLPVLLLQLEIYTRDPSPNPDAFCAQLLKVTRSAPLILPNHRLIMHYIHHLKALSVDHAARVLGTYILTRLAPNDDDHWTEGAIVTLIWIFTSTSGGSGDASTLEAMLNKIHETWNKVLSPEATHGALVLFWKHIEHTLAQTFQEDTVKWCFAALHPLFSNAGDNNVGKIERKIVKCYLDLSNLEAAHDVMENMSSSRKQHPLSRFLRYSLALRRKDEATAQSALGSLATGHDGQNTLLFAAVSEAMKHGSRSQGAQLLQRILDKYKENLPPEVDACALLRCTARLLLSAVSEEGNVSEELPSRICGIFKAAAQYTQKHPGLKGPTSAPQLQECQWFEKTSYNTAIQNIRSWPPTNVIDLLHYSSQIQYPPGSPQKVQQQKAANDANANYVQATLYAIEARSCSATWTAKELPKSAYSGKAPPLPADIKMTLYRCVFDKYTELKSCLTTLDQMPSDNNTPSLEGVQKKLVVVLPLAFEAMLFMSTSSNTNTDCATGHHFDELSLNTIVEQATQLDAPQKTCSILADMVLYASTRCVSEIIRGDSPNNKPFREDQQQRRLPISTTTNLLVKLISGLRMQPGYDTSQAARWIRCVVQVVLDRRSTRSSNDGNPAPAPASSSNDKDDEEDKKQLFTVSMITEQALSLARCSTAMITPTSEPGMSQSQSQRQPGPAPRPNYPVEELEWLATTLFNLSIDLYMSPFSSSLSSEFDTLGSAQKGTHNDMYTPQVWARKALEIADVLGSHIDQTHNGDGEDASGDDGSMLARVLRDRCGKLGWDVTT